MIKQPSRRDRAFEILEQSRLSDLQIDAVAGSRPAGGVAQHGFDKTAPPELPQLKLSLHDYYKFSITSRRI
jgi:hypothetical protein